MRVLSGLVVMALVAGCATPQEACVNKATRDVRRAQTAAAALERDLARGYVEVEEEVTRRHWGWCEVAGDDWPDDGWPDIDRPGWGGHGDRVKDKRQYSQSQRPLRPGPRKERCMVEEEYTITHRERVDVAASQRELAVLKRQIAQGTRPMQAAVAQCRVDFPQE